MHRERVCATQCATYSCTVPVTSDMRFETRHTQPLSSPSARISAHSRAKTISSRPSTPSPCLHVRSLRRTVPCSLCVLYTHNDIRHTRQARSRSTHHAPAPKLAARRTANEVIPSHRPCWDCRRSLAPRAGSRAASTCPLFALAFKTSNIDAV